MVKYPSMQIPKNPYWHFINFLCIYCNANKSTYLYFDVLNQSRHLNLLLRVLLTVMFCYLVTFECHDINIGLTITCCNWAAPSEFGTYRLCEQRRFRRACASAQSRQNLRCSLIQAVSQEEPSDRKPDPWPLWMAGHAQLKLVMTECSKTQIRLTRPN